MTASLLDRARVADFEPGGGVEAGAFRRGFDDGAWLEVPLPTDVHAALLEAGAIPHPYADANESEVAWVAAREWWYRCPIGDVGVPPAPGERVRLVCHGLDTEASLWLNGELLGEHHSTFRPAEFDVTGLLDYDDGVNVLSLRFANLVDAGTDVSDVDVRDALRLRLRRMQVGFGWDISCVLLTVGIPQPIELRRESGASLGPLAFSTVHLEPRRDRAIVRVAAEVDLFAAAADDVEVAYELVAPDGELAGEGTLTRGEGGGLAAYLVVERPHLWWTHDLGEPNLYRLTVSLAVAGEVKAVRHAQVGIRTIELDQAPDPDELPRRFFRFVLNGRPLFARGANWVPEDLRLGTVRGTVYRERLAQAVAANMNCIRVWGGGSYEQDAFYSACDRLGLLCWQDFMFACLPYPDDASFLAECDAEARYQVRRLRAHPSVALWCGNNEAHLNHDPGAGRELFARVLPRAVREEDGSRPYWPGSPYGGEGFNSIDEGDTHDWRGFHGTESGAFGEDGRSDPSGAGRHWRRYATGVGRFVSEFGFASAATRATIEHWIGDAHPPSHVWQDRIRYVPGDSERALLEEITGLPQSAGEWVDFTQLIQAEGVRFGIERFRERKPHCSGALLWQLNDCWPGFTWSIVDFDGRPKPAYYAVKRAFAPVLATVNPQRGGRFEVWLVNDSPHDVDDVIVLRIKRFDGTVLSEQRLDARAGANSAAVLVRRFGWGRVIQPRSTYVTLESEAGTFAQTRQVFADPCRLELPPAEVELTARPVDESTVDVTLEADAFVFLAAVEHPHAELSYTDNYLSLDPRTPRTIRVRHPHDPVDPALFTARVVFGVGAHTPDRLLTRS